jgi:hypothetical protein
MASVLLREQSPDSLPCRVVRLVALTRLGGWLSPPRPCRCHEPIEQRRLKLSRCVVYSMQQLLGSRVLRSEYIDAMAERLSGATTRMQPGCRTLFGTISYSLQFMQMRKRNRTPKAWGLDSTLDTGSPSTFTVNQSKTNPRFWQLLCSSGNITG